MNALFAVLSGVLFGLGLLLSGMTNPAKVQGFLDLTGTWDPSLGLVMGGAIGVGVLAYTLVKRRGRSWSGGPIEMPDATTIDARLICGGVIFGIGWALAGICPGPAFVLLGAGSPAAWLFVPAMLAGMLIHDRLFSN